LEPALIAQLFAAIRAGFNVENTAEITVECAPGQLADETIEALTRAGVNRVSLGVQSFVDREAHVSGRLHNRIMVLDDLRRLRAAGITNLNIDLIAGLAGQTFASWDESLAVLIDARTPHASVYMLEVDEDSRLGRELLGSGTRYHAELVPTDDAIARMYETAIEKLEKAGLAPVRDFQLHAARFSVQTQSALLERRPYLGSGWTPLRLLRAGAEPSSRNRRSELRYILRSKTTEDLKDYLSGPQAVETAWLSPERQQEEAWFLGLRLNGGVKLGALKREFGLEGIGRALTVVERLAESGSCFGWEDGMPYCARTHAVERCISGIPVCGRTCEGPGGNSNNLTDADLCGVRQMCTDGARFMTGNRSDPFPGPVFEQSIEWIQVRIPGLYAIASSASRTTTRGERPGSKQCRSMPTNEAIRQSEGIGSEKTSTRKRSASKFALTELQPGNINWNS